MLPRATPAAAPTPQEVTPHQEPRLRRRRPPRTAGRGHLGRVPVRRARQTLRYLAQADLRA
eukprot:10950245-Lingulodinium_polyedra.AAC.1